MTWETVSEDAFCWDKTHLFRYEPDPVAGGACLKDRDGNNWAVRTCVICGERQRRKIADGEDILDLVSAVAA